jgi:hypothetical protein|tara:strand:+ start:131 stop:688 length:558 start_codon:yes stop_codon:yes gene_type:complete
MKNIYEKLADASKSADAVTKSKAEGVRWNPLSHDSVSLVAMEALNKAGLYPVCTFDEPIVTQGKGMDYATMVCHMKIINVDNPQEVVEVCTSSHFSLNDHATGKGMSYARKYAFLNVLNLETSEDLDEGKNVKPHETKKEITDKHVQDVDNAKTSKDKKAVIEKKLKDGDINDNTDPFELGGAVE